MEKLINLANIHFLYIHKEHLSLEKTDNNQSNFAIELKKHLIKIQKHLKKKYFSNNLIFFLVQVKKFMITLTTEYFQ